MPDCTGVSIGPKVSLSQPRCLLEGMFYCTLYSIRVCPLVQRLHLQRLPKDCRTRETTVLNSLNIPLISEGLTLPTCSKRKQETFILRTDGPTEQQSNMERRSNMQGHLLLQGRFANGAIKMLSTRSLSFLSLPLSFSSLCFFRTTSLQETRKNVRS